MGTEAQTEAGPKEPIKLLMQSFSRKHHYKHEALFREEVIGDLGKLEDLMTKEGREYWSVNELREAMGVGEEDLAKALYVSTLIQYLKDEGKVSSGGLTAPNKYILKKRADEIALREERRNFGNLRITHPVDPTAPDCHYIYRG